MKIFQHEVVGDDFIQDPWFSLGASVKGSWGRMWGIEETMHAADVEGGCLYLDCHGSPVTPKPDSKNFASLIRHHGSIRGAWPVISE